MAVKQKGNWLAVRYNSLIWPSQYLLLGEMIGVLPGARLRQGRYTLNFHYLVVHHSHEWLCTSLTNTRLAIVWRSVANVMECPPKKDSVYRFDVKPCHG